MRPLTLTFIAAILLSICFVSCKSDSSSLPPRPSSIINNTRDQLTPFRFTLSTVPASPDFNHPIMLKVHVIDAADQAADGVALKADVSMSGMDSGAQHIMLSGKGNGDYEGQLELNMGGSWDVDLTATKDGKSRQQKLSIEVGG